MSNTPDTFDPATDLITDDAPIAQHFAGTNARSTWQISLNDLRANVSHMRPSARQVILDAFLWSVKHDVPKPELAEAIGTDDNTIYKIITGRYLHPKTKARLDLSTKMEQSLRRWLDDQIARVQVRTDFIMTPTARKTWDGCELAVESRTPVFLFGGSQIGKTRSLEEYARTHNHGRTIYVRMGAARGEGGMLRIIAKAIGVSPEANRTTLIERIIGALASDMLLIVDEVHQLGLTQSKSSYFKCLEILREFWDVTKCGLVLCFTQLKWCQLREYAGDELEQIYKRGIHRVAVGTVSGCVEPGDVAAVLAAHGLEMPSTKATVIWEGHMEQPYELLRQLAKTDGLTSLLERIRYAKKYVERDGRDQVTWEDIVHAHVSITANAQFAKDWA